VTIVLYTRAGCHLCDEAKDLLRKFSARLRLSMNEVDIDLDAALVERFGDRVPVLEVDGKVRMWGKWNPALLERTLLTRSSAR
jgi:glutaredoxin